ncbi:MAG TPA: Uma2 family endonuclease [Actinoplanes sp.]|nr:Uma2 family endonuclease [Actinoplanes sp.]
MTAALSEIPPPGGWTIADLEALPEDRVRRELLDGVLLVTPSPPSADQVLAMRLMVTLERTCPEHLYVTQANDVRLGEHQLFIPDVLVITDEAARRGDGSYSATEVSLAVEIVSPCTESMDRVLKPALYAKAGIPSYWRVEIDGGITVHAYRLDASDKVYQPSGTFTDVITVDEPWRIEIPVSSLRPRHL